MAKRTLTTYEISITAEGDDFFASVTRRRINGTTQKADSIHAGSATTTEGAQAAADKMIAYLRTREA